MMGAYTALTVVGVVAVVAYELLIARTGIFRTRSYWLSMAIVVFFQVLVDGWLTKRSAPVVIYDPDSFSGVRVGFHSPLEDFGFGFALVTLTMVVWDQLGRRSADAGVEDLADDRPGRVRHSSER
ncbi:lycopene cyclase domain-containing protein [Dermatobacter hominis]|uniref:lycopene cyclase domain-containing protein n=1 Tax=Dermatobacter hominis TaxID=2884263 RepID=UPI001D0FFFAB|nr:lycopene cyclase domain-containing protein [Dermatobacter hominis]UDY34935.1 lycopene cyclase domain-containing protein [Dermatobacter hominis]